MTCPYCESPATTERPACTEMGYRRFRCRACKREVNEGIGTPFNWQLAAVSRRCGLPGSAVTLPGQTAPAILGGDASPAGHWLDA
jgi:hypothetical protein